MKPSNHKDKLLEEAQRHVRRLKLFYLHLALYVIAMALIAYNFVIIEDVPQKDNIISLNLSVVVVWTILISIHGFIVFKERKMFSKTWEDQKMKQFSEADETETQLWE